MNRITVLYSEIYLFLYLIKYVLHLLDTIIAYRDRLNTVLKHINTANCGILELLIELQYFTVKYIHI